MREVVTIIMTHITQQLNAELNEAKMIMRDETEPLNNSTPSTTLWVGYCYCHPKNTV
jgi:hypothetical protein